VARRLLRRLRGRADRLLYPEADAGARQWQRVVLNQAVDRHLRALGTASLAAAEISGADHAGRPWKRYASLDYPEFDLCAPVTEPERYGVVICEQVIEHVIDPAAAARNLRELVVPGGHVVVSTPFMVRVHELPAYGMRDYWRFTPSGLRALLEGAGLTVDEVGSWGNRRAVVGNFDRWPAYRRWLPLRNEPDIPLQVWAFARRPA
jgi:SAM-dependent methyltransferase